MPVALEPIPSMPPLVAIAHDDPGTADSLRHAVEVATGWRVLMADPSPAGLAAALVTGASVALIGCTALGNVPSDCRTPIIAIGDDQRAADVRAALTAGARSLLAWPDGAADLLGELKRVAITGQQDPITGGTGLVIATRGVQGGAGTTTVAIHLAAAWARWGPTPVLLMDLAGGLAFRLDLGAVPTWSTLGSLLGRPDWDVEPFSELASEPPVRVGGGLDGAVREPLVGAGDPFDGSGPEPVVGAGDPFDGPASEPVVRVGNRFDGPIPEPPTEAGNPLQGSPPVPVPGSTDPARRPAGGQLMGAAATGSGLDAATLVGTLAEPWAGLLVLPHAGLADGVPEPTPDPRLVHHVLEVARTTCRVVVVDLPATDGPLIDPVLSQADALVVVGRCETAGVRGLQSAIEAWIASGHDPDTAGAVVTGVRPQAPLAPREVRAALGDRLWGLIPTAAAELAAAAEDGTLLLDRHDLSAVQAMVTLANRVVPFAAVSA
jgi:cellulose biosynthesis protein BcsQ